ncbi:MAG: iron ABC transporter permease [bacterium]
MTPSNNPHTLSKAGKYQKLWLLLTLLSIVLLVFCFIIGRYPRPYFTSPTDLIEDAFTRNILLYFRLPRIVFAFLLGAVLAAAGTVFQMLFRNPLVDSGFLGVSSGAAFGASLAIIAFSGSLAATQTLATLFAIAGLALSYFLSVRFKIDDWMLKLVLAGIAVSALFSSGTGLLKYMADPLKELPEITFWLLGGIWTVTWMDVLHVLPIVLPALLILFIMRWRLNLLSMHDETVFSLMRFANLERLVLLLAAVISTAIMTAKAGQIGWVGLIIPHVVRVFMGSDAQRVLPGSMLVGGLFVLVCDTVARTLSSGEIPLGILSSSIGATIFLVLLLVKRIRVQR